MNEVISTIYGLMIVLLVYGISYFSVIGLTKKKAMPSYYLILTKYFIYWQVIVIGFGKLVPLWILLGIAIGIYVSLPILYYLNKKQNLRSNL